MTTEEFKKVIIDMFYKKQEDSNRPVKLGVFYKKLKKKNNDN